MKTKSTTPKNKELTFKALKSTWAKLDNELAKEKLSNKKKGNK